MEIKQTEQMKATKEVVGTVTKDTLSGGYLGTFEKNKEFFGVIMPYIKNILSYLIISIVYNAYMLYIIKYYTIV